MRTLLIISILMMSFVSLEGQVYEAPVLDCIEVSGSDVNLTWTPPANSSNEFNEFQVYEYVPNGNFSTLLATYSSIAQLTHLDVGTLAATEEIRYFITATYGPSGSLDRVSSDTLSTIDLSLFIDNGIAAILDWNSPFHTDSVPGNGTYEIQIMYQGLWSTLGYRDIGDEHYEYVVDICHGLTPGVQLQFRVLYETTPGCGILSNVRQGTFTDQTPPSTPIIETVTVDTLTNKAEICWLPSPEEDTGGYIVQTDDFITVTTINNPNDTVYQNPASLAAVFSEGYLVVAFDDCYHVPNPSDPPNPTSNTGSAIEATPQFTMALDLEFIKCEQAVEVNWNPYINWPSGVSHYLVYGGIQGVAMSLIDSLGPNANSALHHNVALNTDYCYVVKAIANDLRKPSLSAKVCIFTDYPDVPNYTYLANVSVTGTHQIELKAIVDTTSVKSSYAFQRLDRFGEEFETIAIIPQEDGLGAAQGQVTAYDNEVNTADKIFTYRLLSLDSCGIQFGVSDTSKSMLLEVFADSEVRTNTLTWQHYEKWAGNITEYHIYREVDGAFLPFPYAVVDSSRNYFVDDLSSDMDYESSSTVCYYVEAIEALNPFGIDQRAKSNIKCATMDPLMYIPNAIVINGVNSVFKPIGGYFDKGQYTMDIYDRWGRTMYHSENYAEGWDGQDESGYVQEGVYVYVIRFFSGNGKEYIRRGYLSVFIYEEE